MRRLHELMCQVNAGDDLHSVLQTLVDGVTDVTGFEVAAVSYLHPDQHLQVLAVAGDDRAREQLLGVRTPVEDLGVEFEIADDWGLLKFVPHDRLVGPGHGWIPDVIPLDVPNAWHPEDALLAPLSSPTGEMVGLLSVDLPRDGLRPGQFARDALEMYAAQAGIAISNAKQRERLREEVRLASVVRTVAQSAGRALDLGNVIEASVAPIAQGLACDALWIRAFEGVDGGTGPSLGARHTHPPVVPREPVIALAARVAAQAWRTQSAVTIPGTPLTPAPDLTDEEKDLALALARGAGCNSLLLAPLGAGPECLGYVVLGRESESSTWTPEEVAAVLEIGRDLGRSVLHARLFGREHQLVRELQQLDRYKTEMISTLAHELKSPLTAIIGHLELLETAEDGRATGMSLAAIDRGATRLRDLVEDLLLLSKVGDPHRPLEPTPVDLAEIVANVADMLQAHATRQQVTVRLVGTDQKVLTRGDATELDRVVVNLVGNAVKFSPPGGSVTVIVEESDATVLLRCRDDGIGISPADQERLFTEFFRSTNPAALEVPGTGLGLTIVKRIVERHHGTIALDSALGQGTTFTVELPSAAHD